MEYPWHYYIPTSAIISYVIFSFIGAATVWILLTWANRKVRFLDLVRGAGSWILGPLLVLFINTTIGASEGIGSLVQFAIYGILIGFVTAIAMRACLKQAHLMLSWRYVLISGAIWGIGFTGLLWSPFIGVDYQIGFEAVLMFLIFLVAGIAGSTSLIVGLDKSKAAT